MSEFNQKISQLTGGGAQWPSTKHLLSPEAMLLKSPLVLPVLYALLLAKLPNDLTINFWENSDLFIYF